jgi:hypothetical protein
MLQGGRVALLAPKEIPILADFFVEFVGNDTAQKYHKEHEFQRPTDDSREVMVKLDHATS